MAHNHDLARVLSRSLILDLDGHRGLARSALVLDALSEFFNPPDNLFRL